MIRALNGKEVTWGGVDGNLLFMSKDKLYYGWKSAVLDISDN